MDILIWGPLALILLLTVLTAVMVYVSRDVLDASKSRLKKALWVSSVTLLLLVVAVAGLGAVLYLFGREFD
jgi:hypothetical protein